jgi:dephospho-CoA kinase
MKNDKLIIGLIGQMASGKGTVAEFLKEKYQADFFTFSTPLRDTLKRLHQEISRENMQNISAVLRQLFGQDLLAKIIAKDVEASQSRITVVDGIRRFTDIEFFKDLPNFILVAIIADDKIRYERLIARAQNQGDKQKTFEEFLADHQKEAELEIPKVMNEAKENINNNGDLTDLHEQIDKIISKYSNQ